MDDPLLTAILKSDDSAIVTMLDPESGAYQVETVIDLVESGVASDPLGQQLHDAVVDTELLAREARAPLPDIPVRVVRAMFAVHASFSAMVMLLGYIVYYILTFDESRSVAIFMQIASGVFLTLIGMLMTLIVRLHRDSFDHAMLFPLLGAFATGATAFMGALCSLTDAIVPLQAATVSFAQCLSVYGYTLSFPSAVDPLQCGVYMIIATLLVWLFGLYGFIVQHAWISSGVLFVFGLANAAYLGAQIHMATRYCLSRQDLRKAVLQFYLDPVLWAVPANNGNG